MVGCHVNNLRNFEGNDHYYGIVLKRAKRRGAGSSGGNFGFENLPVTSNRKTWLLCSASMAVLYHLSFKYGTSLCGLATELLKFTYKRPKQTFF